MYIYKTKGVKSLNDDTGYMIRLRIASIERKFANNEIDANTVRAMLTELITTRIGKNKKAETLIKQLCEFITGE